MTQKQTTALITTALLSISLNAQTPSPSAPAPAKPAAAAPATAKPPAKPVAKPVAPKTATPVDNVIALLKAKTSEALIMKTIRKAVDLTPADMVKLKDAGASDQLVGYLMDPSSAASAPATATAASSAAPAAVPPVTPAVPVQAASTTPASTPISIPVSADPNAQKKRVVVDPFDYSTVMTSVQAVFKTNQDIGKGIQAMLVTRLAKDNKVVIVERGKVKEVMNEQDFTAGNRVKQGTGSRIGRISGADAILAGDITVFGRDDKKQSASVGAFGSLCTFCRIGAAAAGSRKEEKAVIVINYRLIDAETTEIIATGEAKGESIRKSNNFAGAMVNAYKGGGAGSIDMTSSNFAETIIGEATMDCVNKLAKIMSEQATTMKKRVREVDATVVDVQGNSVMISAGSAEGVSVGEVFEVLESIREVKDPTTGELLDRVTEKRGEMTIAKVRDRVAEGNYTGTSPAKVRFIARKKLPVQQ